MKSVGLKDGAPARRNLYVGIVLVLIGAGLGAGAYRVIGVPSRSGDWPETKAGIPNLVKNGAQIEIPETSPLRNKLTVESGQALAVLESSDLRTAYADYDRAKLLLGLATKTRDRLRGLGKAGGVAEKDIQQAETDFLTAEAEFQRAEARLNQIGAAADTANTSRVLTISSPISGSVIDLAVAPVTFWNDPNAPLMTVADLTTIWVTANVPEKDIALVAKDQRVNVTFVAYPGEVLEGRVLFVSQILDPDTRRAKVRIAFPNPEDRLKPAMFATVTFFTPAQNMPVVPTTALVLKGDSNKVFVETAPWTFEPRPVKTGFQQGDQIVIQEGLKAGDRIVAKGGVLLND